MVTELGKLPRLFSQQVVRTKRHPPLRLDPGPAETHPVHRRFQVVVTDVPGRHPTEDPERLDMALHERLLGLGDEHPVHRLARVRHPQREQVTLHRLPGQAHPHVGEVDLSLSARLMQLRHGALQMPARLPRLRHDLAPAPRHILGHRRVRRRLEPVLDT
jgi:hypothetical protein